MSPRNFYEPLYELEKSAGKVDVFFLSLMQPTNKMTVESLSFLSRFFSLLHKLRKSWRN